MEGCFSLQLSFRVETQGSHGAAYRIGKKGFKPLIRSLQMEMVFCLMLSEVN